MQKLFTFVVLLCAALFCSANNEMGIIHKAVVVLKGPSNVTGVVTFEQTWRHSSVCIKGTIKGLDPNAKRGVHVHQFGNATDGCASSGLHFNPYNKNHGAPWDKERHVGDLGNIESDASGVVHWDTEDNVISLNGPNSIIGRTLVIHVATDDLGKGNPPDTFTTGNAGARAACGIIGIA